MTPYSLWHCIKNGSLELFDRMTANDVIPLTEKIQLVRYRDDEINKKNTTYPYVISKEKKQFAWNEW